MFNRLPTSQKVFNAKEQDSRHVMLSPTEFQDEKVSYTLTKSQETAEGTSINHGELIRETVPSTISDAIHRFFFGPERGPMAVLVSISFLILYRIMLIQSTSFGPLDVCVGTSSIIFWWFQEHFLHCHFLHSQFNWVGKEIHDYHHEKPYFHISIDPTPLLLGWLVIAHLTLRALLPLKLALTGTICYAIAGMWYEWTHFIVHTRVKPKSKFMKVVKNNHIRHHLCSEEYWLGFSLPLVDDLFGTNPSIKLVQERRKQKRR